MSIVERALVSFFIALVFFSISAYIGYEAYLGFTGQDGKQIIAPYILEFIKKLYN